MTRPKSTPPVERKPQRDGPARTVEAFLAHASRLQPPALRTTQRVIFALDATASREPTWDLACSLHAELFGVAARHGNIAIQLCHYGGHEEFVASPWAMTPEALLDDMLRVRCKGGRTQLVRVLEHAISEATRHPVRALVFIGDAFEEDERALIAAAGKLALFGVPAFVCHEGGDPTAFRAFSALARITRGALVPFAPGSAASLREFFGAVAAYATGGLDALEHLATQRGDGPSRQLLEQLKP